jgi:cytoskeletal protein RodZ
MLLENLILLMLCQPLSFRDVAFVVAPPIPAQQGTLVEGSVTKAANAHTVVATGWTSPANAYVDNTTAATAAPAKNNNVTGDFGFPAFTTSDIPATATITSVTVSYRVLSSTSGSVSSFDYQINNGGTLLGTADSQAQVLTATTVTKTETAGISLDDLRTANKVRARAQAIRGNSNTAVTWSLQYVWITVNFEYYE